MAFKNRYYGTKKVEFEGMTFDSGTEVQRFQVLRAAQERGLISGLQLQVVFTLIPRQTEPVEVKLKTKTKVVEKFCEHPVTYAADFVYHKDGKEVVEDIKGFPTEDYILKRKMMRYFGHPIHEVFDPTEGFEEIAASLGFSKKLKKKSKKKSKPEEKKADAFDAPGLFD